MTKNKFIIIYANGEYIFHYDKEFGLLGENNSYSLKDQFPKIHNKIIKNDSFHSDKLHVFKLKSLEKVGNYKLIVLDDSYEDNEK